MLKCKGTVPTLKPNYLLIPVTQTSKYTEFNEVVEYYQSKGYFHKGIERTPSGGISLKNLKIPAYDVRSNSWGAELLVLSKIEDGGYFRLQFRSATKGGVEQEQVVHGKQALNKFKQDLNKIGINLEDYYTTNGLEIKKTIEPYRIELLKDSYRDIEFANAHHIDINSSFPSGVVDTFPEFGPVIQDYYNKRKVNPEYKQILNLMIGTMQSSKYFGAKLAHISKEAIRINNAKISAMIDWLKANKRVPILINTDGIWFVGEPVDFNSNKLGEWKQDHKNCRLRIKSKGCYEFIEDNQYYPVARGARLLDKIKPRAQWEWGDIYKEDCGKIKCYKLVDEKIMEVYENEN